MSRGRDNQTVSDYYNDNKNGMIVLHPKGYDDIENAISILRDNKSVIVYLETVKSADAQRIIDLLSGAVFALEGQVYQINPDIVMLLPGGVKIINND